MKDKWNTFSIALILAILMTLFELLDDYFTYGDEMINSLFSPIGALVWLGGFVLSFLLFYVVIDVATKWNKRKK